jgi:TolB-like protein/class 3 adenylate cyclase/Flp pilus assembly protein TadD
MRVPILFISIRHLTRMSTEQQSPLRLEIGHVLLIDIVGYSKLLIDEQSQFLRELSEIVRSTEQYRSAAADGKLLRLPTGDGMALVFRDNPEAPAKCALEISAALKSHPEVKVRMGIHCGPVNEVLDVTERANIAGAGINIAQRVMDCGDAGHILLSKHVADDLEQYRQWRPYLHDLGECEVKHGGKIDIVNLYTDELGNPRLPQKFAVNRKEGRHVGSRSVWVVGGVSAVAILLIGGILFLRSSNLFKERNTGASGSVTIPEKSIAVLPFENLSDEKQNAYFADGVQDEILTDLAKVPDLKVISRTSVIRYRTDVARDLREIGRQLGVAHVVEGSVQRSGDRIRVNAQLIDARTDAHLWAKTYDRNLADVFAIQSEIAKSIAQELRASLSPNIKAAIEEPPTADVVAFDLYTRAKTLLLAIGFSGLKKGVDQYSRATELLNAAVARDPNFFLAYYQLARAHSEVYLFAIDHTPGRRVMMDEALRNAERLRPDAGETHLARAFYFYRFDLDYDRARAEVQAAAASLPNNPDVYSLTAYIDRRQSRWSEAIQGLEKALQLDPRNVFLLRQISLTYQVLRRYPEMAAALDRSLALDSTDIDNRIGRARAELHWRGDPQPLHKTIHAILDADPSAAGNVADWWFDLARCERDAREIGAAFAVISEVGIRDEGLIFPRAYCEGVADSVRGDSSSARDAFTRARTEQERIVRDQPDFAAAVCVLGVIDAALGRKDEAIAEGRRATELLPVTKEPINGANIMKYLGVIYAQCGEKDLAIEQIRTTLQHPGDLSYGLLKLHPYWDSLRGDPRFEKIVASLAPKEADK